MDITTSNRIYDEIARIVGTCLHEMGERLEADQVAILAIDIDRDAGIDMACALGRLALDAGDLDAIRRAVEIQKDRVRSIMAMSAPGDPSFMAVHLQDITEAKTRVYLMQTYLAGNLERVEYIYRKFMRFQRARR